jgi:hypothetical protein
MAGRGRLAVHRRGPEALHQFIFPCETALRPATGSIMLIISQNDFVVKEDRGRFIATFMAALRMNRCFLLLF